MDISVSDNKVNFKPKTVNSYQELADVITSSKWSPSTYKNEYRNKENFEQVKLIALDFDSGLSIEEAKTRASAYQYIIAPTKSHRKQKNGVVCDRFRLVIPLTEPICDPEIYQATWNAVFKLFPECDTACRDVSRYFDPSTTIDSIKDTGVRITPVPPPPKEYKEPVDRSSLPAGARGKLGREALEFLCFGVDQGNRNHSAYKVAKEFQQALYSKEEAMEHIVASLEKTGTIAPDFPESEVRAAIESAYGTEAKHDPRIKAHAFSMVQIGELYKAVPNKEMEWLVHGLCQTAGVSLLAGEPKTGKSEVARQLCVNVLNGTDFLGRKVQKGSVHYFGMEEDLQLLVSNFHKRGVAPGDPLYVHAGDPMEDTDVMGDFKELILRERPALAVVDTAFDILPVESEKDLMPIKRAFRQIRKIARESKTHIMLIHHSGKPQQGNYRSANHSVLGSTGITAGVDNIAVIQLRGTTRLISTSGRGVDPWYGRPLVWDKATKTYSLGPEPVEDEF